MSTFKKLFASIAAVMIVVSTAPVAVFGQTSRSTEYQDAYAFAFANGITTMSSIDGARLADTTTRAEFAKMASAYAENVLELTPDTSASCSFSDLAPVAGTDLADYAVKACQLGLMGIGTNGIFNPMGVLSRAEAFTVMSRMFYGDTYNGGNPYYAAHMNALQQAGLVNDLSNPTRPIIRGDVMLVLKRSSEADLSVTPGFCSDIETVFACTIDPDGSMGLCPAACLGGTEPTDPVDPKQVKAGNLGASLSSDTPQAMSVPAVATRIPFLTTRLSASSNDITVNTVTVKRIGLGSNSGILGAYLYRGSQRLTDSRSISSSTNEIRFSNLGFVVKAGSTEELTLRVDLSGSVSAQYAFSISEIDSSAVAVSGLPVNGNTMNLAEVTLGTVTVEDRTIATSEASVGQQNVEVAKFNVAVNTVERGYLKAITLSASWSARINDVNNFKLLHNGTVIATADSLTRAGSNDSVTFVLDNPILIDKGGDVTLSVRADIANARPNDTFGLRLANDADVLVDGDEYGFGLNVTNSYLTTSLITIDAGKLTFAYDGPVSQNVGKGSSNVVLAVFNVNNESGAPVEVRSLPMVLSGQGGTDYLYTGSIATFTNIRLVRYTNNTVGSILSSVNEATSGTTLALNFSDSFMVPTGASKVAVIANIPSSVATEGVYYVSFNPSAGDFRSDTNEVINDVVPSSAIVSNNKTLVQSSLTASYGATPNAATYVRGQNDRAIGSVVLAAVDAWDIKVNSLTLTFSWAAANLAQSTVAGLRLMDGETEVASLNSYSNAGTVVFNNLNFTVPSGSSKTLTVRGNISSNSATYANTVLRTLVSSIEAEQTVGTQSSINVSTIAGSAGTFGVQAGGSVAVAVVNYPSQIVTAGADDVKVAEFSMRASALSYTLDKVTFTVTGEMSNLKSDGFSLWMGTTEVVSNGTLQLLSPSVGIVRFNSAGVELPQDVTKYLTLKASFNTVGTNGAVAGSENTFGIYVNADATEDVKVIPQNAQGINNLVDTGVFAATLYGNAHTVYKAVPAVALQTGSTSSVPFKVTVTNPANADGSISFSGLTLNGNIGNFTGGTFTGYLRITQGGSQLHQTAAEGVVITDGDSTLWTWLVFALWANAVEIQPGATITVEFYLTGRPANSGWSLAPYASFYVDSDGAPGAAGNFVWFDGTTSFNGYKIINSRIEGTQFNY